ncbi:hypothetical protein DFH28DRAFT_1097194 [Melampsora americana]|nr:hypothetical protein DFH28DRAFT_1097194 [Melampsora americana]
MPSDRPLTEAELKHIEKLSTACSGRSGNEPSSTGCIPLEKPSRVNSKTVQSQSILPIPDQSSQDCAAYDVRKHDVELNQKMKIECQRNEILRLKLQLLEKEKLEMDLIYRQQKGTSQVASIEPSITPALDPGSPKLDYDTLNRVLRLSHAFQSRGSSDDQLVIIEAFGQACISVLHNCRDSLDPQQRRGLFSPSQASRLTEGTLQWISKVVMEIDDWVSRTGQEAEWKIWVEDVKSRIYQELYPILTLILEAFIPTSQDICSQITTKLRKSVFELKESSVSLLQTLLVYFEPEITISLASNVLTKLKFEIWASPPEEPPIGLKPETLMSRSMGVSSGTTASQLSRLRTRWIELTREESVIYLVNGLRIFCDAYCGAMIIPEQKQEDIKRTNLDSYKIFSRYASQLQELKQLAGETLEKVINIARKSLLSESSMRDLVSVLEQIWVL